MMTRRFLAAALGCFAAMLCMAGRVAAAEPSAQDFVAGIYGNYKGKDSKGASIDSEVAVRGYFEPALAALILSDRKRADKRNEVPTLDGDPFVDAQEWEVENIEVNVRASAADKAVATVKFKNFGKDTSAELDLVKLKTGWRIADIRTESGSLRGLFAKK
jgi:hypothetical protein